MTKPEVSVRLRQAFTYSVPCTVHMDRIVNSESCGEVKIDDCTVQRLLFADDLVLFDSTQNGVQQALDMF